MPETLPKAPLLLTPVQVWQKSIHLSKSVIECFWLKTMLYHGNHAPGALSYAAVQVAERGVRSQFDLDHISLSSPLRERSLQIPGRLWSPIELSIKQSVKRLIGMMENAGVDVKVNNKPDLIAGMIPVFARNHMKFIGGDRKWVIITGANIADVNFRQSDFGVLFTDPAIVNPMREIADEIHKDRLVKNQSIKCNDEYEILITAGGKPTLAGMIRQVFTLLRRSDESVIYEKAKEMLGRAKENIIFASQLPPDFGILDIILGKASEGKNVEIFTSLSSASNLERFPTAQRFERFLSKIKPYPNIKFQHHPYSFVHSKLAMIDTYEKDGEILAGEAMFGSENYHLFGVILATGENAIWTSDPRLIRQLYGYSRSLT